MDEHESRHSEFFGGRRRLRVPPFFRSSSSSRATVFALDRRSPNAFATLQRFDNAFSSRHVVAPMTFVIDVRVPPSLSTVVAKRCATHIHTHTHAFHSQSQ
jgi:hypothetical protein